jgi:hypothetical protein
MPLVNTISYYLKELLGGLNESMNVKWLEQTLSHSKYWVPINS